MMKRIFLIAIITSLMVYSLRAQYKPADKGSSLTFKIKNLGFDVNGSFTGLHGTINFDVNDAANGHFDITVDATTVNTDNSLRDEHLRGDSYFDVKNYPVIHLVSTKITAAGKGTFILSGKLTMKGKSQDVSFPFTTVAYNDGLLFKGSFKINRKDFDVGGTSTIANELEVFLNVFAQKV